MHRNTLHSRLVAGLFCLLCSAALAGDKLSEELLSAHFYNALEQAAQHGSAARRLERAGHGQAALDAYLEACDLLERALTLVFHRNWPVTRLPWNALLMTGTAHMDAARQLQRLGETHFAVVAHLEAAEKAYDNLLFREDELKPRDARHAPSKLLAQAHFELGNIQLFHEQYRRARRAYARALELDPRHRSARRRLQQLNCRYPPNCKRAVYREPRPGDPGGTQATQINIILAPLERDSEDIGIYQHVLQTLP